VITIYTEPDGAKVRHLAANDQVTVNFNSTPFGTDVVVISGRAELVPDSPPPTRVPGLMEKYSARIEQMGYTLEWFDSYSLAIRVTPERAWTI
jgi:PPOX class probable F420-dependent enzyme